MSLLTRFTSSFTFIISSLHIAFFAFIISQHYMENSGSGKQIDKQKNYGM